MYDEPYRLATDEEFSLAECDETYSLLVGPNNFECLLTEPEDRTWYRDAVTVVKQLNKLHAINADLLALARRVAEVFEGSTDPQEETMYAQAVAAIARAESA